MLITFFTKDAQAARSINIIADKSQLFGEEEANITTALSGFTDGETIYIKGAFYQDGTTNYFGYTKSGDSWIKNGSSSTAQKQVKVGEWDGKLNVKSDFADSGFKGEGEYKFKVGFYYITSGGNLSSVNWSANVLDFNISEPDPSPSPMPSPTPTPIQSTAKSPSPSPTSVKSPLPSPKKSPEVLGTVEASSSAQSPTPSPDPSPSPQIKSQSKTKIAGMLTGSGAIIIGASVGFFLWQKKVLGKKEEGKD